MKSRKTRAFAFFSVRLGAFLLSAVLLASLLLHSSFFAAQNLAFGGNGTLEYLPSVDDYPLEKQQTDLRDCGFVVGSDDASLSLDSTSRVSINRQNIVDRHDKLKELGILQYLLFETDGNSCDTSVSINGAEYVFVILLDFSKFTITSFHDGFLSQTMYSVTGCNEALGQGKTFSGESVVYYDKNGVSRTDITVTAAMGGFSWADASSLTVNGSEYSLSHFTLRIKLPENVDTDGNATSIRFESNSLVLRGYSIGFITFTPSVPLAIEFDLGRLSPANGTEADNAPLTIADDATDTLKHFHYIAATSEQKKFALSESFKRSGTGYESYINEVFVKGNSITDFSKLAARISTDENGSVTATDENGNPVDRSYFG